MNNQSKDKKVVIIGGGFGGLATARALKNQPGVSVTLVDKRNHHLFQPLLYQTATSVLNPSEIATPLRALLRKARNVTVLMDTVVGFKEGKLQLQDGEDLEYDQLVVAAGSEYNYFGNPQWEKYAPALKTLEDALKIRARMLRSFEEAERHPERAEELLTFVIVGGGPTGVELAGQIAELKCHGLKGNYRNFDPTEARVIIVDAAPEVLTPFGGKLARSAHQQLESLGVELILGEAVEEIADTYVKLPSQTIPTRTAIWAAGVRANDLAHRFNDDLGLEVGPGGRILVDKYLRAKGQEHIYVVGDIAQAPAPLPGLASVAMQMGRYVANTIMYEREDKAPAAFEYHDKGSLATIGRHRAVGKVKGLELTGTLAWVLWLTIHLRYLAGLQNRVFVLMRWMISYFTYGRSARLITEVTENDQA